MIKMRIRNILVGFGPIPSAITLQAYTDEDAQQDELKVTVDVAYEEPPQTPDSAPNMLPIRMGVGDTAAIAAAIEGKNERPVTHALLANVIGALGGTLESVSITRVEGTTFFATLDIKTPDGAFHHIDARPSDAIALALQAEVDILAAEELLEQAGSPDFDAIADQEHKRQAEEFHNFVETLSPEDFEVHKDE